MPPKTDTKAFSTRFLASDGIPEYNALLDQHLGKRREFLLGNRKSLELLKQTGVIARVEKQTDNPNQYVVHMKGKPSTGVRRKRLPAPSSTDDRDAPWRAPPNTTMMPYGSSFNLRSSATASKLATGGHMSDMEIREEDEDEEDEDEDQDPGEQRGYAHGNQQRQFVRSRNLSSQRSNRLSNNRSLNSSDESSDFDRSRFMPSTSGTLNPSTAAKLTALKNLGKSQSSAVLLRSKSIVPSPMSGLSTIHSSFNDRQRADSTPAVNETTPLARHRSLSELAISTPIRRGDPSTNSLVREDCSTNTPCGSKKVTSQKTTVEHLLESDAAFVTQIRSMKEQLDGLTEEKARLDDQIAKVRKKLRGVNAVHENDVAVAHCAAIMQQRLSKAEEEYMKLVTSQQQVKTEVDRVRRELLSLKDVKRKLETDIEDVQNTNASILEKIHATKGTRNALSEELASLEQQAEAQLEEQKMSLPPEDVVVVDVSRLMSAVRHPSNPTGEEAAPTTATATDPIKLQTHASNMAPGIRLDSTGLKAGAAKDPHHTHYPDPATTARVDYCAVFASVQQSIESSSVSELAKQFTATEEQLLSKYKASLSLQEELAELRKQQEGLASDRAARHANIRGSIQASISLEHAMQLKIHSLQDRIAAYNVLREERNEESARLRAVMMKCLESLQAEALMSGQGSLTHPLSVSELPSSVLLEGLQKKMTEVAIAIKLKYGASSVESSESCFDTPLGHSGRRINKLSTREVSKIVLGPRDPPGSTLSAILESVQPPTVETALAMTEASAENGTTSGGGERGSIAVCPVSTIVVSSKRSPDIGPPSAHTASSLSRRRTAYFTH